MIFATGMALKSSPAACFDEIVRKPSVWMPLVGEARRYKSFRTITDETSAYLEYAKYCPNHWLGDYMVDLVSNMRGGGNLPRFTQEKLEDAIAGFVRDLGSRAEFLMILTGGAMLMYATMPLLILSMALMFVGLGGAGQAEVLITFSYILLAASTLFIPIGEMVKPEFEYRLDKDPRLIVLSIALPLATIALSLHVNLPYNLLLYLLLLGLGTPLMVMFIRSDRMNMALLTGASRFLFDLQERSRYGLPLMVAITRLSERNYSKPLDLLIRRFVSNLNLLGPEGAFRSIYAQAGNDYVRRLFGLIEFTHRSGAEDPSLYFTFDQFFRKIIGGIQSFRRTALSYSLIAALGVGVMLIGVSSMLGGVSQIQQLGSAQASAINTIVGNVKLLIPVLSFASGCLAGYFGTGIIVGAFREGTILTALALVLGLTLQVV